ncbi:FadR/GntR family transcriptional regulator [Ramlibacter sp. PS4R-6]|uniref:FadR/GntR family transcriptional regulator n=1 Tax=Ramlibacter sp. PS4R-6 TaxID=3133438 RepID=UPI0030AE1465
MPLQTLEPQRLYRQIAEQLRALMTQGEFKPGARLPAERDLAKQMGVSRPSVREALIALEVEGWVEVRTGSGVFVLDRAQQKIETRKVADDEWGPLEIIRARRLIEGEIAALAAAHAKRKDIQAIREAIDLMHEDTERGIAPTAGDRAFHTAIAEAAGNAVLVDTVRTFWDARRGPLFERLGDYFENVPSWRTAIGEHEAILEAIRAHDAEAAREAMHAHMDKSHARFSASWSKANPH